jgi:hypothetical protein
VPVRLILFHLGDFKSLFGTLNFLSLTGLKKTNASEAQAALAGVMLAESHAAAPRPAAHPPVPFHQWIAHQTERRDAVADIARDVVDDIIESRRKLKEQRIDHRHTLEIRPPRNEEERLSLEKTFAKEKEELRRSRCPRRNVRLSQQSQQWIRFLDMRGAHAAAKEAFNKAFAEYRSAMARVGYHEQTASDTNSPHARNRQRVVKVFHS